MALPTASDNPFPSILITEGTEPSAPAAGKQRLYIDSTTHKLKRTDSSGTDVTIEGAASGAITSSGLTMATARLLGRTTASTGAIEEISVGASLSLSAGVLAMATVTIVNQDISGDFTTANDSAWHDVTGMTGISLVAGTWLGFIDVEHEGTSHYGPVFRITDGTNTLGQAGHINNYLATVSTHTHFTPKPFVLGSTTSVKLQVFSDTVFKIKQYPTRGADSSSVATHAMFWKLTA